LFRPSLFWKIFGSSIALILLTAIVAGWLAERRIVDDVEQETRADLRSRVDLLTALVRDRLPADFDPAFQDEIRAIGTRIDTRLTIIRPDGLVLADSRKDPRVMDDHSTRPEVLASREQEFGSSTRTSATLQMRMVYVAHALRGDDGTLRAYVRGSLPLVRLQERLRGLRGMILGGAAFAVLVGLLAALLVARRLARPLRQMAEVAGAIAGGDLQRRVAVTTRDEVGDLGRRFNEMAVRVEEDVATIDRDRRELRAILRGMAEGVIAVDAEDRVVLINEAARDMLQLSGMEVEGNPLWASVRLPSAADALARARKDGKPHTTVLRIPRDGRERALRLHASPVVGEDGLHRGAVMVVADITEREQIEAIRRDFIANASHELKTPIASIRGLVETILEDGEMPVATRTGFLERVVRQISRLGNLVEEMLALSRLESREAAVTQRRTDLRAPLREVVEIARPLAAEREVTLAVELPESEILVRAEPESVHRIASNLLDNAIKYSGRNKHVAVRVYRTGANVVLEVRDDGPGIPKEKHNRIFERFFRVDEHRSRQLGGTGLGLAIVKHLVQAHGGRIELESAPGAGSTFRVMFQAG